MIAFPFLYAIVIQFLSIVVHNRTRSSVAGYRNLIQKIKYKYAQHIAFTLSATIFTSHHLVFLSGLSWSSLSSLPPYQSSSCFLAWPFMVLFVFLSTLPTTLSLVLHVALLMNRKHSSFYCFVCTLLMRAHLYTCTCKIFFSNFFGLVRRMKFFHFSTFKNQYLLI